MANSQKPKQDIDGPASEEEADHWLSFIHNLPEDYQKNQDIIKRLEEALIGLGKIYRNAKDAEKLANHVSESRPLLLPLSRAKTAKIVRTLIDYMGEIPGALETNIRVTKDCVQWAQESHRSFLVQSFQIRLVGFYIDNSQYHDALTLLADVLKQLKKLDDKLLLVEVHLLESKAYHAIRNIPKSRAALTAARTNANVIYISPVLQAGLDMQSAILHAEDFDFKTAYSYFYEAFENYKQAQHPRAIFALKYMLLSLIMLNSVDELNQILSSHVTIQFKGKDLDAMMAIAKAHEKRSLSDFEKSFQGYKDELQSDPIIRRHFTALYDNMLEQNLVKVIEPFSRVEIQHIADTVGLPVQQVEGKLSQMILDRVFYGVLDQGAGCLNVFPEPKPDQTYAAAIDVIQNVNTIVDLLIERKATKLV